MVLNACGGPEAILELEDDMFDLEDFEETEEDEDEPVEEEATLEIETEVKLETDSSLEEVSTSDYTDGSYTANGSYSSPAGSEAISVKLTLKDDIVTAVSVTVLAENSTSIDFQNKFAGGVSSQVIGVDMDQLSVGNVAGSSLTPKGFNAAVASIKAQAAS